MVFQDAWSDVTLQGDDFLDGGPKDGVDFFFLFICCVVAVPRNQDDSMQILEELWFPVESFAIVQFWVSEIFECIFLLTH